MTDHDGGPDRGDIADLYAASYRRLVGLLTAIGGSSADAEEVVQDAFAHLLGRWDRVGEYDDPEAWVRMVAVRTLLKRIRRRRVAAAALPRLARSARSVEPAPTGEAVDVAAALRQLSPELRVLVALHYIADLPLAAAAHELGIPVGTAKSRLSRARAALAPLLTLAEENHA